MSAVTIPAQTIGIGTQIVLASSCAVLLALLGALIAYLFSQTKTNRDVMVLLQVTTATLSANQQNLVADVSEMKIDVKGIRTAVEESAREGSAMSVILAQQGEKLRQLRCQREGDAAQT